HRSNRGRSRIAKPIQQSEQTNQQTVSMTWSVEWPLKWTCVRQGAIDRPLDGNKMAAAWVVIDCHKDQTHFAVTIDATPANSHASVPPIEPICKAWSSRRFVCHAATEPTGSHT